MNDDTVELKTTCRNILNEINKFGINDRQRKYLIHLLSLELEDPEASHDLSIVSRTFCETCGMIMRQPD